MNCPECGNEIKLPKEDMINLYLQKKRSISAHCKSCDKKFKTKIFVDVSFFIDEYDYEVDMDEVEKLDE